MNKNSVWIAKVWSEQEPNTLTLYTASRYNVHEEPRAESEMVNIMLVHGRIIIDAIADGKDYQLNEEGGFTYEVLSRLAFLYNKTNGYFLCEHQQKDKAYTKIIDVASLDYGMAYYKAQDRILGGGFDDIADYKDMTDRLKSVEMFINKDIMFTPDIVPSAFTVAQKYLFEADYIKVRYTDKVLASNVPQTKHPEGKQYVECEECGHGAAKFIKTELVKEELDFIMNLLPE